MDISVYRRKNKHPLAITLLREFYHDYARSCSKKERALTKETPKPTIRRNLTQEMSQFMNFSSSRNQVNSPRALISDTDANIIKPLFEKKRKHH